MGAGIWRTDVYDAAATYRASTGKSAFDYSDSVTRRNRAEWRVHESLDPKGPEGTGTTRESRDSAEHPESTPIAVLFDVTGSMRSVPRTLQEKLPGLLGLLLRKGYVEHPQIMFGAIGDATCDRAPLQVGQFESDNRMDEHLGNILLEGGGGGQRTESYEMAMWYMSRRVHTDAWEKRGKRGYLFIIGDELAYPTAKAREIERFVGVSTEDMDTRALVAELTRKWDTYYLLPEGSSYAGDPQVLEAWRDLLGQNVLCLDDLSAVCETIALTIGLAEDSIDLAEGLDHLAEIGSDAGASVGRALATVGGSSRVSGSLTGFDATGPSTARRL